MKRFLYRTLIALHPPRFRERFGDEMMCVFDESAARGDAKLFADALLSLARQWLLHSGLWKLATGAVVSGLILCGWGYAFTHGTNTSLERELQALTGNPYFYRPPSSLDEREFEREAAQAVAILAEIRKAEEAKQAATERQNRRREKQHLPQNSPADTSPTKG